MGYTTLKNQGRVKEDEEFTLEGAALRFIRERCEQLRFDKSKATSMNSDALDFEGTSVKVKQIPFNIKIYNRRRIRRAREESSAPS